MKENEGKNNNLSIEQVENIKRELIEIKVKEKLQLKLDKINRKRRIRKEIEIIIIEKSRLDKQMN